MPYYIFEETELPLERFNLSSNETFLTPQELRRVQNAYGLKIEDGKSSSSELPKPFPSARTKEQLLSKIDISAIDARTSKCEAPSNRMDWDGFVQLLTADCKTDLERVRTLYYWIGNFDFDSVADGKFEEGSLMDYVSRCRKDDLFYEVFECLCRSCKVQFKEVIGIKKSVSYRVGHSLNPSNDEGRWQAVFVEGEWRFIDALWGCCKVSGADSGEWQKIEEKGDLKSTKKSEGKNVYFGDEYYFLTDPENLIFSHFPDDPDWQLLVNPITLEMFEEMARIKAAEFTKMDLTIVSHPKCVLQVPPSGELTIKFKENGPKRLYLIQLFLHAGSNRKGESKIVLHEVEFSLRRFLEYQRVMSSQVAIKFTPPKRGKYLFQLFGSMSTNSSHTLLIEYVVHCPTTKRKIIPQPERLDGTELGMGLRADLLSVVPVSHNGGEVELTNGEAEVCVRAERDLEYECELFCEKVSFNKVVHWSEENGKHVFRVMGPDRGLHSLSINAREKGTSDQYTQIGQYLVEADTSAEDVLEYSFPEDSQIGWSKSDKNIKSSMEPLNPHKKPLIICRENELKISWTTSGNSFLTAELRLIEKNLISNCNGRLFIDYSTPKKNTFQLNFPQMGHYELNIFKNNPDDTNPQLIFKYFIRVLGKPSNDQHPFPQTNLSIWRFGFKLVKPKTAYLQPRTKSEIIIEAPVDFPVKKLVLSDEKKRIRMFDKKGNNRWEINFTTESAGIVSVLINRSSGGNKNPSYEDLLQFCILSEIKQNELKQKNDEIKDAFEEKRLRDHLRIKEKKLHEIEKTKEIKQLQNMERIESESKKENDITSYLDGNIESCLSNNIETGWNTIEIKEKSYMRPLSPHDNALIDCHEAELKIVWSTSGDSFLTAQLLFFENLKENETSNCDEHLFIDYSTQKKCTSFKIKFPHLGIYLLKIFEKHLNDDNSQLIFTYFIRALGLPSNDQHPFPKVNLGIWQQGFKLLQPTTAYLQPLTDIVIIIDAPPKIPVNALILCDEKKNRKFERKEGNRWEINFISASAGILDVLIDQSNDFEDLLQFEIISKSKQKELEKRIEDNKVAFKEKKRRDNLRKAEEKESQRLINEKMERLKNQQKNEKEMEKEQKVLVKQNLTQALTTMSEKQIEKCLKEYCSLFKEEDFLINKAKKYLKLLTLIKDLQKAINTALIDGKAEPLVAAIKKVESSELTWDIVPYPINDIDQGKALFKKIDRFTKITVKVLEINAKTLLELRNYSNPLESVKRVVQGTLLILGYYEKRTRKWKRCQPLLKGILKDIKAFNPLMKRIHPGLAARAEQLMKDVTLEEVAFQSGAAAAFYQWSKSIIDLTREDIQDEDFKPASIKEQRKILSISDEEEADLNWEDDGIR